MGVQFAERADKPLFFIGLGLGSVFGGLAAVRLLSHYGKLHPRFLLDNLWIRSGPGDSVISQVYEFSGAGIPPGCQPALTWAARLEPGSPQMQRLLELNGQAHRVTVTTVSTLASSFFFVLAYSSRPTWQTNRV